MNDKTLLWVSLFSGLFGLLVLAFLFYNYDLEPMSIGEAKMSGEGSKVHVVGKVNSFRSFGNITVFSIERVESLKAVIFSNVSLNRGTRVDAYGKINYYDGELQLQVEKLLVTD